MDKQHIRETDMVLLEAHRVNAAIDLEEHFLRTQLDAFVNRTGSPAVAALLEDLAADLREYRAFDGRLDMADHYREQLRLAIHALDVMGFVMYVATHTVSFSASTEDQIAGYPHLIKAVQVVTVDKACKSLRIPFHYALKTWKSPELPSSGQVRMYVPRTYRIESYLARIGEGGEA
ncbi:hypothetical protein [Niveibacterium microcysteis]|uniref:Uncharacterized protein n=1 Tax=Niveibacterium microcysteis TaxID=2811415 RepID=A0ABX7M3L0_9RHOO|nr:hypothetical protein [Niveibacterium microcysteis]QSI76343.1 hypothetical protein JY500_18025 [Niveibacterium microcysteis]